MGSTELDGIKLTSISNILMDAIKSGEADEQETPLTHHFAKGVYAREMLIPKGTVLVGKLHRYECINIMLSGDITVYDGGERKRINKPFIKTSPPGTQRAGYTHEDTVWICIHGTNETDLGIIEEEFISKSNNDPVMIDEIRRLRAKE